MKFWSTSPQGLQVVRHGHILQALLNVLSKLKYYKSPGKTTCSECWLLDPIEVPGLHAVMQGYILIPEVRAFFRLWLATLPNLKNCKSSGKAALPKFCVNKTQRFKDCALPRKATYAKFNQATPRFPIFGYKHCRLSRNASCQARHIFKALREQAAEAQGLRATTHDLILHVQPAVKQATLFKLWWQTLPNLKSYKQSGMATLSQARCRHNSGPKDCK